MAEENIENKEEDNNIKITNPQSIEDLKEIIDTFIKFHTRMNPYEKYVINSEIYYENSLIDKDTYERQLERLEEWKKRLDTFINDINDMKIRKQQTCEGEEKTRLIKTNKDWADCLHMFNMILGEGKRYDDEIKESAKKK